MDTSSSIKRLGKRLKNSTIPDEKDLRALQQYRLSYRNSLKTVFDVLCHLGNEVNNNCICSFRIKRLDSIIDKLRRLEGKIQLNSMWDIAGCRCILQKDAEVYALCKSIKESKELFFVRDKNMMGSFVKESGYRSIHMYVSCKSDCSKIIEIQLRTNAQHDWATFVEITDLLYHIRYKEGIEPTDNYLKKTYNDFSILHVLISKSKYRPDEKLKRHGKNITGISDPEKNKILYLIIKHDVIRQLNKVFIKNIPSVMLQWFSINSTRMSDFLISTSKTLDPTINAFDNAIDAEKAYFEKFESNKNRENIVLIHIPNTTFEQINIAYANYLLTTHRFIHLICTLIIDLFKTSMSNKARRKLFPYALYFIKSSNIMKKQIELEKNEASKYTQKTSSNASAWIRDISNRLKRLSNDANNFIKILIEISKIEQEKNPLKKLLLNIRLRIS